MIQDIYCQKMHFFDGTFLVKKCLETIAVVSKPQYQINFPLLMARAHAEAISNRLRPKAAAAKRLCSIPLF